MSSRTLTTSSFETLLIAAPSGILAVEASGVIFATNEAAAHVCGYKPAELIGQHLSLLVPSEHRCRHMGLFAQFLDSPQRRPMGAGREFEITHKSGCLVPVEIGLEPCLVNTTSIILATVIDVSKRKAAERNRASFLRACGSLDAFECVGLPAALLDSDAVIVACNCLFERTKHSVMEATTAVLQRRVAETVKSALKSRKPHGLKIDKAQDAKPTIAVVIPISDDIAHAEAASARALMIIHSSSRIEPIGPELLKEVFDLTSAEAKVAGLLARGARVAEIASQLSVSKETIRTELSHINSKVGVSSQVELVALLAAFLKQQN